MAQVLIPVFITVAAALLILSYQQAFATDTIISSDTTLGGVAEGDTVIINPGVKVRATGEIASTLINNGILEANDGFRIFGQGTLTNNEGGIVVSISPVGFQMGGGTFNNAGLFTVFDHIDGNIAICYKIVDGSCLDGYPIINNQPTGVVYGGSIDGTHNLIFNNSGIIACNVDFDGLTSYIGNRPICDATLFSNQGMQLFEGNSLSDEVLSLNQPLRVVALHNTGFCVDPSNPDCPDFGAVDLTISWINPSGDTVRQIHFNAPTGYDSFSPDMEGEWMIVADFGGGDVFAKSVNVPINVVPESAIGAVALVGSSLAVLGAFICFKRQNTTQP